MLFAQTGGIPKDINRLCDLSLPAAMGEGRTTVDAEIVNTAVEELQPRNQTFNDLPEAREFARYSVS